MEAAQGIQVPKQKKVRPSTAKPKQNPPSYKQFISQSKPRVAGKDRAARITSAKPKKSTSGGKKRAAVKTAIEQIQNEAEPTNE